MTTSPSYVGWFNCFLKCLTEQGVHLGKHTYREAHNRTNLSICEIESFEGKSRYLSADIWQPVYTGRYDKRYVTPMYNSQYTMADMCRPCLFLLSPFPLCTAVSKTNAKTNKSVSHTCIYMHTYIYRQRLSTLWKTLRNPMNTLKLNIIEDFIRGYQRRGETIIENYIGVRMKR